MNQTVRTDVSTQLALESVYSRKWTRKWIKDHIRENTDTVLSEWAERASLAIQIYSEGQYSYDSKNARTEALRASEKGSWEIMLDVATAVLHKTTDSTYQEVSGYLSQDMPHEDVWDRVKTAAELIAVCKDLGLFEIERKGSGKSARIKCAFSIDTEIESWITDTIPALPMLCEPKEVVNNRNCGYLLAEEPVILNKHAYHENNIALDVINILNKQAWELDTSVLMDAECSKEPIYDWERWMDHIDMVKKSWYMYRLILKEGNTVWFCHQYDSRGRIYTRGYHVNLQSTEFKKALLSFKRKEVIK